MVSIHLNMTLSKLMTASLLGAMSFSSGALAKRDLRNVEIPEDFNGTTPTVDCLVTAITSEEAMEEARADAVSKTASFFCGGNGAASTEAVTQATAYAYAQAVAQASGGCRVKKGFGAEGYFTPKELSIIEGDAWLQVFADEVTAAASCSACEDFNESWEYVSNNVILKAHDAVLVSEDIESMDLRTKIFAVFAYSQDIEAAVATAYAEPVAVVQTVYDRHGCYAFGVSHDCPPSFLYPNGECECVAQTITKSNVEQIDAIAAAVTVANAVTCGDQEVTPALAYPMASELAQATAEALALVYIDCGADEGGYACAEAEGFIETSSRAVAEVFVEAWAVALTCSECTVDVEAATASLGNVLVGAAADAHMHACAGEGGSWSVEEIKAHVETNYAEAIVSIIVGEIHSAAGSFCPASPHPHRIGIVPAPAPSPSSL